MKYNIQGQCPFCNSENINYNSLEIVDNMVYYSTTCENCKKSFKEWYTLNFVEITE